MTAPTPPSASPTDPDPATRSGRGATEAGAMAADTAPASDTPPVSAADSASAHGSVVRPRRRHGRPGWGWALWLVGLAVPVGLIGALGWALGTEPGSAWTLSQLQPQIEVQSPSGRLLGRFSARRIIVHVRDEGAARDNRIELDAVQWASPRLRFTRDPQSWFGLALAELSAERVTLNFAPGDGPAKLPDSLQLPLELEVQKLRIGTLVLSNEQGLPLQQLQAHLTLGAAGGSEHRLERLSLQAGPLQLSGRAQIGTRAPLALDLQLEATQAPSTDSASTLVLPPWAQSLRAGWRAQLQAKGPLSRFEAQAALRAQDQSLDGSATVALLDPWPLPRLDLRTEALDLSALLTDAPATALTGQVNITPTDGAQRGLSATASLSNARPGRWDERRLPLRTVELTVQGRPDQPDRFDITAFDAMLAAGGRDAGSVQGSGQWDAGRYALAVRLAGLQPAALDRRLPAVTLSGPLSVTGRADASVPLELRADLTGQLPAAGSAALPAARGASTARAPARREPAGRAVQVRVDAAISALRIDVRDLQASAGAARAQLSGVAKRQRDSAPWQLKTLATFRAFDPLLWFPGALQPLLGDGPHRVTGTASADITLPLALSSPPPSQSLLTGLLTIEGSAAMNLSDSLLAGVPLRGDLALRHPGGQPVGVQLMLAAASNLVKADGQIDIGPSGAKDHWAIDLNMPALAKLQPLLRLLGLPDPYDRPTGAVTGQVRVDGRWPAIQTQGRLDAVGLGAAGLSLARGDATWQVGSGPDDALQLQARVTEARRGTQVLERAQLQLSGSAREHRINLQATARAVPPDWAETLQGEGVTGATQSRLELQARGELSGPWPRGTPSSLPWAWRGTLQSLDVRGNASDGAAAPVWLRTQDLAVALQLGNGTAAHRVAVNTGHAELFGARLRWDRLAWQGDSPAGRATLDLQADMEALAVAPLLARVQPAFGWGGDLSVKGTVKVRSAGSFNADIVLERAGGDLSVTDEAGTQKLGLTDLRLALNARDGRWAFTQALAGESLGVAAGAVTANVAADAYWPPSSTPIQGVLEARVTNLGAWGGWVPSGWRLGGSLHTGATIGGTFGAPEYTGEVRGSDITVRNLLEGVSLQQGEVLVALQGASARIERFEARGGTGRVRLEGNASLGATPEANLKLVADKFTLLGRVDRRIVTTGSAQLKLDATSLQLDGRFDIDEGLFDITRNDAPRLADDVVVVGRRGKEAPPSAPAARPPRAVRMDLQVDLGQRLRLRGRGLDTGLRGDLRLTAPGGRLAINGAVRTEGGNYAAYGQKLEIERGVLIFSGPVDSPRLDIEAIRPKLDIRVGVTVRGTAQAPRVRLFSEPEMSDTDKLSWLVLGRAPEGLSRADTAVLQQAAMALLAGDGASRTDQLIRSIGLDEVSLRQTDGEVRETVISLGKQLSERWYVGYERGLNATEGTWQLIYRIARRFTLRAQSGRDNSVDVIWTWRWQ